MIIDVYYSSFLQVYNFLRWNYKRSVHIVFHLDLISYLQVRLNKLITHSQYHYCFRIRFILDLILRSIVRSNKIINIFRVSLARINYYTSTPITVHKKAKNVCIHKYLYDKHYLFLITNTNNLLIIGQKTVHNSSLNFYSMYNVSTNNMLLYLYLFEST